MNAYCSGTNSACFSITKYNPALTSDVSNTFSTASKIACNVSFSKKLLILIERLLKSVPLSKSTIPFAKISLIIILTASANNTPSASKSIWLASITLMSYTFSVTYARISSNLTSNTLSLNNVSIDLTIGSVLFQSIRSLSNKIPNALKSTTLCKISIIEFKSSITNSVP